MFATFPAVLDTATGSKMDFAQLSSALSSACDLKSHFCKQCGPRSEGAV